MRFIFKTNYNQDIDLFQHGGQRFWYGLLALVVLAAPLLTDVYWISEIASVYILAVAGVGLMLLSGYTGLASLGHAAFLGIGAYAEAVLLQQGLPFFLSIPIAGMIAGAVGVMIGLPTLRLSGLYLSIATLAFGLIVEQIFIRWEGLTGGFRGFAVDHANLFGIDFSEGVPFYYLCLAILVLSLLGVLNLLRSPTGRALIALRDSEIAAQSMGVNLTIYRTIAFAMSAFFTGLAGALFAHKIGFLAPDAFNVLLSIQLLLLVVVGGLGSLHGAIYGAIFIGALPNFIAIGREFLPAHIASQPGLEPGLFGLILVLFIIFEPLGIYGRWLKVKLYFDLFPMYKQATFKKQKSYTKSERNR